MLAAALMRMLNAALMPILIIPDVSDICPLQAGRDQNEKHIHLTFVLLFTQKNMNTTISLECRQTQTSDACLIHVLPVLNNAK